MAHVFYVFHVFSKFTCKYNSIVLYMALASLFVSGMIHFDLVLTLAAFQHNYMVHNVVWFLVLSICFSSYFLVLLTFGAWNNLL